MKISSLLLVIFFLYPITNISAQQTKKVEWLTATEYDFGDITQGNPVVFTFKFKNISGEPLTIDNVRTTCGCTAPDWSFEAIAPDAVGEINIEYDAEKERYFRKKIMVFFNGQRKSDKLYVEGYVE